MAHEAADPGAPSAATARRRLSTNLTAHARIIWALLLRELATRYGRQNLGFLWIIAEPLLFCIVVVLLWKVSKPSFEHGVAIVPFVVSGYMPIIVVRHMINHALTCVTANGALLYHRQITVLHLFAARLTLEFVGVTLAFAAIVSFLVLFGFMEPPKTLYLVYLGWFMISWISFGLAMILGALAEMVVFVERLVAAVTYIIVPLSGTFYMAGWLPPQYREIVLYLPFLHPVEMIRGGFFGDSVRTYFDLGYAVAWAGGLTFVGLLMLRFVRDRIEVD